MGTVPHRSRHHKPLTKNPKPNILNPRLKTLNPGVGEDRGHHSYQWGFNQRVGWRCVGGGECCGWSGSSGYDGGRGGGGGTKVGADGRRGCDISCHHDDESCFLVVQVPCAVQRRGLRCRWGSRLPIGYTAKLMMSRLTGKSRLPRQLDRISRLSRLRIGPLIRAKGLGLLGKIK